MNPSDPTQPQDYAPDSNTTMTPSQPTIPTAVPETAATEPIQPVAELTPELIANNATQQVVSMAHTSPGVSVPTEQPSIPQQAPVRPAPVFQPAPQPALVQPPVPPTATPEPLAVPPPLAAPTFPTKKKGSFKAIIVTLIVLIVIALLTIGGIVAWRAFAQSPTDHFYHALENAMSTKYAKLDFAIKDASATTAYTALVDVTDPTKPNANIKVIATSTTGGEKAEMDIITIGTADSYTKYTSNQKAASSFNTGDKWIKSTSSSSNSTATGSTSALSMNYFSLGNYDTSLRDEIIKTYKEQRALQFNDSDVTEDTSSGTKLLRYSTTVNAAAMKAINDKVAQASKLTNISSLTENEKVVLWINPSTNKIVRFEVKGTLGATDRMTINITYPSQATITAPSDYMTTDEWAKSLSQ